MRDSTSGDSYEQFLDICAREPIHRPGSIQSTGVLVAVERVGLEIRHASANIENLLPFTASEALGLPLQALVGAENTRRLTDAVGLGAWRDAVVVGLSLESCGEKNPIDALVFHANDLLVIEFELPELADPLRSPEHLEAARAAFWRLDKEADTDGYLQKVVDLVRELTGYDRVMLYRFEQNWDGEVICESRRAKVQSYLGNRFPASDIPAQARELYTRNLVRLIADIDGEPVPLVPFCSRDDGADALDLSHSGSRSFSPVHIEYLRNMEVRATLTLSLVMNGRLWGLIACHHRSPRYVPIRTRELYELFARSVSLKLLYLQTADSHAQHETAHESLGRLTWNIRKARNPQSILDCCGSELVGVVNAGGVAICLSGQVHLFGNTPNREQVSALLEWPRLLQVPDVFSTDDLVSEFPPAQEYQDFANGLIAVPLGRGVGDLMMWFRPALQRIFKWAGKPEKVTVQDAGGGRLSPRASFATWIENCRDRSKPWTPLEVQVANAVALAVVEVLNHSALRSSEAKYRLLAEHSTDMILRIGGDGLCSFASPASREILGVDPSALVGRRMEQFVDTHDSAAWAGALGKLASGEPAEPVLLRFRHEHGHAVWIEAVLKPVNEADGGEIVVNARDITQRHNYQLAIEDLHRRNTSLLDGAGDGVMGVDAAGRVMYANESAAQMLGRSCDAMAGQDCLEVLQFLDVQDRVSGRRDHPLVRSIADAETYQDKRAAVRHPKGHRVGIEYLCTPLLEGSRVDGGVIIFRPVLGGRHDDRLREADDLTLREAEDAVMVTDARGSITAVNRSFSNITGYALEEVLGQSPKVLRSGIHTRNFYDLLWESLLRDGRWQGEIWNRRKSGEIYPQWASISAVLDDKERLRNYVAVFSDVSKVKHAEQQLHYLANHDALTGLPNRLQLTDHLVRSLERAKRGQHKVALVFLDLDRFKAINDSLGHQAGDQYLKTLGGRLQGVTRSEDFIARWGGDEFVLVYERVRGEAEVADIGRRILGALAAPVSISGHEFVPTASIGIGIYPDDAENSHDLIRAADSAMYRAKESGRNNFQFSTPRQRGEAKRRSDIAAEIRGALRDSEFVLHYQPQLNTDTHTIVGFEALIRWRHRRRGLLRPHDFLPQARELGLMPEIGDWVVGEASRQVRVWDEMGMKPPRVAVNIDPAELSQDFPARVARIINAAGVDVGRIELEITEGALDANTEVLDVLFELKARGFKLSVDDFGTGYSSLSHIKRFPVSAFKIDKSFIDGVPEDHRDIAIVRAIIALSGSLDVGVVAEGVETAGQFECLKATGVKTIQGNYLSEPIPATQVESILHAQ